ncbi:MAG TPA: molybdopterin-binding protein, partial [Acidimicrobiales bacterium]|nr:molybdopterin-binding protein [Acidimicrobiales bacterium]
MECETLAVGTELLLGQITNTNAAWIGEQLALRGIDHHRQVVVGDNLARIVAALQEALGRADAVIVCGGLGPTQDDITREAIAEVMGVELRRDGSLVDAMRDVFARRGREMPASNLRQADVPVGATPIRQRVGTAPGLICPVGDKVIYAVPGVPHEMREMLERAVLPDLESRAGERRVIVSRVLRVWGESESRLAELLAPRMAALDETGDVTLAFLASGIEGIRVRLTAAGASAPEVDARLDEEETQVRAILGDRIFSSADEPMEAVVG